ncbi:hypothetical protein R3P38DRAFT_2761576 [Favolaschia claudopus]|uniref:Uncharacterized protein n=1 Tax=Favolaschia claudopus TaxID=2862362 RepID=A0AAW0DS06_9AGAR
MLCIVPINSDKGILDPCPILPSLPQFLAIHSNIWLTQSPNQFTFQGGWGWVVVLFISFFLSVHYAPMWWGYDLFKWRAKLHANNNGYTPNPLVLVTPRRRRRLAHAVADNIHHPKQRQVQKKNSRRRRRRLACAVADNLHHPNSVQVKLDSGLAPRVLGIPAAAAANSCASSPSTRPLCVIGNRSAPASISDILEVAVPVAGHTNAKPSKRRDGFFIPSSDEVRCTVLSASRTRVKDTKLRIELGLEEDEFDEQYYRILAFIDYWVIKLAAGKLPYQLARNFWPVLIGHIRDEFLHIYQGPYLLARVRATVHHVRQYCFPDIKLNMNRNKPIVIVGPDLSMRIFDNNFIAPTSCTPLITPDVDHEYHSSSASGSAELATTGFSGYCRYSVPTLATALAS